MHNDSMVQTLSNAKHILVIKLRYIGDSMDAPVC